MEKERMEWEKMIKSGEPIPAKIEVGGCACCLPEDIFETLPLEVCGGWDGNFVPNMVVGILEKEGDVALNVCPNCMGSITWRVIDDTGRAYFELPY